MPIEWNGKKVAVRLIEKSITQTVLEILDEKGLLKSTLGIFLAGSYARGEENEKSDIDILVITENISKQLKVGNYEITFIPKDKLYRLLKKSLYLNALIREAKAILNNELLQQYKKEASFLSIKSHLREIKSISKIHEDSISIDEGLGEKISDGIIYSLVLRLRELYLIECMKNNEISSNSKFIHLLGKISCTKCYESYLRVKNDLKPRVVIPVREARSLISEIKKRIARLEHDKEN